MGRLGSVVGRQLVLSLAPQAVQAGCVLGIAPPVLARACPRLRAVAAAASESRLRTAAA